MGIVGGLSCNSLTVIGYWNAEVVVSKFVCFLFVLL